MKSLWKMSSVLLILILVLQLTTSGAFAAAKPSPQISVLLENIDEENGVAVQIAEVEDSIFYSYVDENISYCSEVSTTNKMQFSYALAGTNKICVSGLYDLDEICDKYGLAQTEDGYVLINKTVIDNIADFEIESQVAIAAPPATRGASTLSAAITDAFGANYTGLEIDTTSEFYNGRTYIVRCKESQTTTYTTPERFAVAKDMAVTTIITWLLTGGWSWVGLGVALVTTVVETAVFDGIRYTVKNFTAERSDVTLMLTRLITVDGYSGTQYWSGWTRKMYFLKGDLGWAHDANFHYNIKDANYDEVDYLMNRGYNNFINNL